MALAATSAPGVRNVRDVRTPALLFGLCLLLTAAATALVAYAEGQAASARFEEDAVVARDRIDERMSSYLALLRGAAGLFSRPEPVSPEEFRIFVERLRLPENYPGTLGLGYSHRFGALSVDEAAEQARALGWTRVRIWPETPRDEVHAIVLIEPLDARNRVALGYDMRSEATRREAMDRARDTGASALSGKVTLVQELHEDEARRQPGFLVYTPVYAGGTVPPTVAERRAKLVGYAYMPLRAGDLLEGVFRDGTSLTRFDLHDGEVVDPSTRLHARGDPIEPGDDVVVERLEIAGRVWTARFARPIASGPGFPLALAVASLGLLLSSVVLLVSVARQDAQDRELRARTAAAASAEMLRVSETFVGILGHDLRSPLNAISMGAHLLVEKRPDDPVVQRIASRIVGSSQRMAWMIDEILDLTRERLGGGIAISPRTADLGHIACDVVDEAQHAHPDQALEVEAAGDLQGVWDAERLAQVFSNLLANAMRHAEGEPVRVELSGTTPDQVVVTVHNAGVIPAAIVPVIFDPFRGGSMKSRSGGLGLGLYITRSLVRAHGGSLAVTTAEGQGTTFTVVLPRYPPAREPETAGAEAPAPLGRTAASSST